MALDGHVENEWLHVWFGSNEGWMSQTAVVQVQRGHEIDALEQVDTDSLARDEDDFPAVCNGVPGECEGNIGCYLSRIGLLEGTYLHEEPHGLSC